MKTYSSDKPDANAKILRDAKDSQKTPETRYRVHVWKCSKYADSFISVAVRTLLKSVKYSIVSAEAIPEKMQNKFDEFVSDSVPRILYTLLLEGRALLEIQLDASRNEYLDAYELTVDNCYPIIYDDFLYGWRQNLKRPRSPSGQEIPKVMFPHESYFEFSPDQILDFHLNPENTDYSDADPSKFVSCMMALFNDAGEQRIPPVNYNGESDLLKEFQDVLYKQIPIALNRLINMVPVNANNWRNYIVVAEPRNR